MKPGLRASGSGASSPKETAPPQREKQPGRPGAPAGSPASRQHISCPVRDQGLAGLKSELSLQQGRGAGEAGGAEGAGGAGESRGGSGPRPLQLLASARTSQVARLGCNLGKFFRFLSFLFFLS